MRNLITYSLILIFSGYAVTAMAQGSRKQNSSSMDQEFNSLGTSDEILNKARALDPENKVRVVQTRAVSRDLRLEFGVQYGLIGGGDSYVVSDQTGAQIEFHINPKFSIGGRINKYANRLTAEGSNAYADADAKLIAGNKNYLFPVIDYPIQSSLVTMSFYPIYGKVNLFDIAVTQFDFYMLAGAGKMKTANLDSNLYSGGVGIGFWLSKHVTSRMELRYQTYSESVLNEVRRVDNVIGNFGLGLLL